VSPALPRLAAALALWAAAVSPAPAREVALAGGLCLDLPAGFTAAEAEGGARWSFLSPDGHLELAVLAYAPGRYASAEALAAELLERLGSRGQRSGFTYQGRQAVIAELSFVLGDAERKGYALFSAGKAESGYALLAHVEAARFDAQGELVISCLDGFSPDPGARRSPGPVSQFLLAWPPERRERKAVRLPGGAVELPWSSEEARHELYVAEREHGILSRYAESRTLWIDAWARFYRMVYRDSADRLEELAAAFTRSLPADDPTECARRVLAWVQGFTFERDVAGLDFVPPLTAAFEQRGDCDARAMVMAVLLERLGIDCVLMLSREYSHALLGVDVPGGGRRFPFGGREYLIAETTARVGLGMIDAAQADFSKWLGVELGGPRR